MAIDRPTLVLIGLRGSGKTTLARALAERLGVACADLDDDVRAALGSPTVADAFRDHGEPAFRRAEADALRARLERPGEILALGGGTPTAPGAADLLRAAREAGSARVVYLSAPPGALRARLSAGDPNRPSLTGGDPLDEIARVHADRDPLYRSIADEIIDASCARDVVLSDLLSLVGGLGGWSDQAAIE